MSKTTRRSKWRGLFALAMFASAIAALVLTATPTQAMDVAINSTDQDWWNSVADPFKTGYQNVDPNDPNPFKQVFLDEMSIFVGMRMMDYNQTNEVPWQVSHDPAWANRKQKTDPNQRPMAYEYQIQLANQLGRDLWVTVPHNAEPGYGYNLAVLIRDNLNPNLKVYVEYSNETWNFGFGQAQYCVDQGVALGLDPDQYIAGYKYYVYRAVRLFEEFEQAFGSQTSTRVVKVLAGQSVNTWLTGVHLDALDDPVINPNGTRPDVYAIAPYVGSSATSVQDLYNELPNVVNDVAAQHAAVTARGLQLVAYEGGQHVLNNADVINRDPGIYDWYKAYLDAMAPYITVFYLYANYSGFDSGGAWGLKEYQGQPLSEAHKYRAVLDWINQNSGGGDTTPPAAPAGLTATAGDSVVHLDWADNTESDLSSYRVYRSTTSGSGYSLIASGVTASAYSDTSAVNGTTYYYVVTAVDTSSNESGYSNEASATPQDAGPPAAPTGLTATGGDGVVNLDWADNTESDLASYNVYRSTTSGSGYAQIASGVTASAYSDTGVVNGATYYYVVTAVDTSSNESGYSNEASATPQASGGGGGGGTVTLNPTDDDSDASGRCTSSDLPFGQWTYSFLRFDLSSISGSVNSATLRLYYTPESGARTLFVHDASTDSWSQCGTLPSKGATQMGSVAVDAIGWYEIDVTSYVDAEVQGDGVITFTISSDQSSWKYFSSKEGSNPPELVISSTGGGGGGGDTTPPAAPANLTATAGDGVVDLDWADNTESDLASYSVYRSTTSGSGYTQIASGLTASAYSDTSVTNGTTYYYVVTAVDTSSNESGYSNEASATPQASGGGGGGGPSTDATILSTSTAPAIDGTAESVWSGANSYTVSNPLSGGTGGSDLGATWRALWDSNNLYFFVEVTDEAQFNDSGASPWDDDSVEIYIDADNSKGSTYDGVNDFQYIFRWNDATVHVGSNSATNTAGITFSMAAVAGGYNVEISIPWTTLGVTPSAGHLLGLDVHVNDDDDGGARDGKIAWYATTDNSWQDPSLFATADLAGAGGGDTTPPAAPTGLTATAGDGVVDLDWADNTDSDLASYNVYRSTTSGSGYTQIASGLTASAYSDTSVTNGTTYYYVVTAVDTSGNESGYSNEASATPQASGGGGGGGGGSVTLNPTDDDANTSGRCTSSDLPFSQWTHTFLRFDLSSVGGPVTSATLRVYYAPETGARPLIVNDATTDAWSQCNSLPSKGSTQMGSVTVDATGWYEIDVTSYVAAEAQGDGVITFTISSDQGNWKYITSKEGANPPELVVTW